MNMDKHIIELNAKERYLLWAVVSWFRPLVTRSLLRKLYPGQPARAKYESQYQRAIEDRLIHLGRWLREYREEQKEKQ
jgi:hypothetical protein